MKIAVLSGKGGTGKTFVSVNLAVVAKNSTYIDCDVEEPNGRLFLKPEDLTSTAVNVKVPSFDVDKCVGCKKCVDFCRFNAIAFIKDKPKLFMGVCHSCGGCAIACPSMAIMETDRQVGEVQKGRYKGVTVVTGVMNTGEESGIPVIKGALKQGLDENEITVIDCPPGSACSVMESVEKSDFCVLVAELTAFGLHNFIMVYELVTLLNKPLCAVINKENGDYPEFNEYCKQHNIPIFLSVPYSEELALIGADAKIAVEHDTKCQEMFKDLLEKIAYEVKGAGKR